MRRGLLATVIAGAAALPAAQASAATQLGVAELLPQTAVGAPEARARTCHARIATGRPGVVTRRLVTSATGMVRATLRASGGDWDLGVFHAATGRSLAGSAHFGSDELAEGFVRGGTPIVVQACRRSGPSSVARVRVANVALAAPDGEHARLVSVAVPTPASRDLLESLELDLTEHATPGFQDVVLYTDAEQRRLRAAGLPFTTIVADLPAADRAALFSRRESRLGPPMPIPSGRIQYRRLPDFASDLKALVDAHPDWIKPLTLPHKSLEGRPIEGVEIGRDVKGHDGRPVFVNMGVHHAREWPAGEMPMEWAIELAEGIESRDERVLDLLQKARVVVIPIINPDGFNLSREALVDSQQPVVDPDFAYKRKNCRVVDGQIPAEGECGQQQNRRLGTDPNRNYGQFWGGPGAGAGPAGETYRGAGPFSEPEVQNVRELVSTRQIQTLVTNHTYSDLVLRPPGLKSQGEPPDESIYKALGDAMAAENGYTSQKGWELYDTTGTTEDWSYNATGGLGFTFEIGYARPESTLVGVGFHPAYPVGVIAEYYGKTPTGGGNREAFFVALEHTTDSGHHAILAGEAPAGARIRLTKSFMTFATGEEAAPFQDVLDTSMTVPASGSFEYHVNQSTRPIAIKEGRPAEAWTVECVTPDGTVGSRQEVIVGRGERKAMGRLCTGLPAAAGRPSLKVTTGSARGALRRGLAVRASCDVPCSLTARLTAKLGRRTVTLARASRTAAGAAATFRLRLSHNAAARVNRLRRVRATLRVTATSADGRSVTRSRKVTLTRD